MIPSAKVECPHCQWKPSGEALWNCQACGAEMDMFADLGRCAQCGEQHEVVSCLAYAGGCDQPSPLFDWYDEDFDRGLEQMNIHRH